jgi:hypothetical protein
LNPERQTGSVRNVGHWPAPAVANWRCVKMAGHRSIRTRLPERFYAIVGCGECVLPAFAWVFIKGVLLQRGFAVAALTWWIAMFSGIFPCQVAEAVGRRSQEEANRQWHSGGNALSRSVRQEHSQPEKTSYVRLAKKTKRTFSRWRERTVRSELALGRVGHKDCDEVLRNGWNNFAH